MKNFVKIYFLLFLIGCESIQKKLQEEAERASAWDKPYYRMTPISNFLNGIGEIQHKVEMAKIRGSQYSPIEDLEEIETQVRIAKDIYDDNVTIHNQKINYYNNNFFVRNSYLSVALKSKSSELAQYYSTIISFHTELRRLIEKIKAIEERNLKNEIKIKESILKRFEKTI